MSRGKASPSGKTLLEKNVEQESRKRSRKKVDVISDVVSVDGKIKNSAKFDDSVRGRSAKKDLSLPKASFDKYFILCDGRTISGYLDLVLMLEAMDDNIFFYHVNAERNDFATWISEVFNDEKLGSNIRLCKSRSDTILLLYKVLFNLCASYYGLNTDTENRNLSSLITKSIYLSDSNNIINTCEVKNETNNDVKNTVSISNPNPNASQ
jgi:hypothetical protein